ncbi:MAG: alpha-ketoacid dehydrogenase subunit beta [Pseudomonadales bacterium]
MAEMTMVEALNHTLEREMARDDDVLLLGEDVGIDGGVFRVTDGLREEFGAGRVLDTPLAEAGIVGASVGMALAGLRPVCELQFSGFSYFAFHQIESHAARMRWRSGGGLTVPMVVRMPYGAGVRALEHHSESREVYFAHTPGLKTVIPSSPRTAKSLLSAAIRDPDPVIFMEPKQIYRSLRQDVPDEDDVHRIGQARVVRPGSDLTVIGYGAMVSRLEACASTLAEDDGVEVELIDLLSLSPLDEETLVTSVKKTGRALIVHEAPGSYGPAGEITTRLVERCFYHLQAPVGRVTGYDIMTPYFARESYQVPDEARILASAREVLDAQA